MRSTNVEPGCLAYVVNRKDRVPDTPDLIGRIVYVERDYKPGIDLITNAVTGQAVRSHTLPTEPTWMISAHQPMPAKVRIGTEPWMDWTTLERPLGDSFLRPISDPQLYIPEGDVDSLYATAPAPERVDVKEIDYALLTQ